MLSSKSKIVITIYKKMKEMKTLKKFLFMSMMMLVSATAMYAEESNVTNEVDTTYIKLDENMEPINYVNST